MRIELEKQNTADECFDELAYIAFNFKKFLKDPELKVQPMGPLMKKYTWYALLETVVMLALWMLFGQGIFFYLAELFFIILLFLQLYKIRVNSYIAPYKLAAMKAKALEISEEAVVYDTEDKTYSNSWNAILKVLVNKNSVVFLPKEATTVCIATSSNKADQIIEAVEKAGKEELIIDNRNR